MVKRLKDSGVLGKLRHSGKIVKRLSGFGFLEVEPGQEYFFHFSECRLNKEQIQRGQRVTFTLKESKKPGELMAAEIRPL